MLPPNPFMSSSCDKHLSFSRAGKLHNLSRGWGERFPSIALADESGREEQSGVNKRKGEDAERKTEREGGEGNSQ